KPNQDAIRFLHDEIMPIVWKEIPGLKVNIIGSYATDFVKALNTETFNIIGFVDDVKEYFNNSRLFIAPLRYGAGIKGKIGQSLEYSLPLVTTSIGAEGFDFMDKEEVMIANTAEEIADKIINLYTDKKLWEFTSDTCESILEPFSYN